MSNPGDSLGKVRYDLRPAKQVERLMLIDAFRRLERAGLPICDYEYIGMGSIHFYDYILFHRYLGIRRMVSAEIRQDYKKRVLFNKPFKFVKIRMREIGDLIDELPSSRRVVLWLDYDDRLQRSHLEDLGRAVGRLAAGSVILLTIDLEHLKNSKVNALDFYRERLGNLVPGTWTSKRFTPSTIRETVAALIDRMIRRGLLGRSGFTFEPFVQFVYQDGHRMLSLGGVVATARERRILQRARLNEEVYYRPSLLADPYLIEVPVLTRRERLYLDTNMPSNTKWRPTRFEMQEAELAAYREIYRFTPMFAELIA